MKRLLLAMTLVFAATLGLSAWYSRHTASLARAERWQAHQAGQAAEALLDRPITFGGEQITLAKLCEFISTQTGLEVSIDEQEISQFLNQPLPAYYFLSNGGELPTPQTVPVRLPYGTLPFRSGLELALEPRDLAYELQGREMVITTAASADAPLKTIVYPLPRLTTQGPDERDWFRLIEQQIVPWDWIGSGGRGHLTKVPGAIIVVHRPAVHRQVKQLLDAFAELETQPSALPPYPRPMAFEGPQRRRILAILDQPSSIRAVEIPLSAILAELSTRHGVPIAIDDRRLETSAKHLENPITKNPSGISLRTLLQQLLADAELTVVVRNETLLITRSDFPDSVMPTLVYPVHDLVTRPDGTDLESLVGVIAATGAPYSWNRVGGPGSIESFGDGWLVVSHTQEVHDWLEWLLASLRQGIAAGGSPRVVAPRQIGPDNARIFAALEQPVPLSFDNALLREVCTELSEQWTIPILLDAKPLGEAGVSTSTPITCDLPAAPLRIQLDWILKEMDLDWSTGEEALLITTPETSEERLTAGVYDVRPLLDPDLGMLTEDELLDLITAAVAPTSWDEVGGPGSQAIVQGMLVLSQTEQVQLEVERFLTALQQHARPPQSRQTIQPQVALTEPTSSAVQIEQTLGQIIEVDYCGVRLDELLRDLARRCDLPLVLDARRDWGPRPSFEHFVSISSRHRTLGGVLDEILAPLELGYAVDRHFLVVTTADRASESDLELRLYRVDDLTRRGDPQELRALADRMQSIIQPGSWEPQGGPLLARVLRSGWLVVVADWPTHRQIDDWLAEQRTGGQPPSAVERNELKRLLETFELNRRPHEPDPFGAP